MKELLRIPARGDGYALAAELFLPQGPPRAAVLIAGAMAVRAGFYAPLARYLAEQGAPALIMVPAVLRTRRVRPGAAAMGH